MLDPSKYQNDERPAFMEEQGLSYAVISPDPEGGLADIGGTVCTGYAARDVAFRAAQHRHYWAMAANKETWKHSRLDT